MGGMYVKAKERQGGIKRTERRVERKRGRDKKKGKCWKVGRGEL